MGKASRSKGKRGELELSHELQRLGFQAAHRSQQYCGMASSADVIGLPSVHIECKRTESLSLYTAYEQAVRDSAGSSDLPVVMHRRSRRSWLVIMSLSDWAKLYRAYVGRKDHKSEFLAPTAPNEDSVF